MVTTGIIRELFSGTDGGVGEELSFAHEGTLASRKENPLLHAAITTILLLVAVGQSSLASTIVSFPAMLDGGSRGVPHLNGTIYLSETRIEFEAFPQVENMTLPCTAIRAAGHPRRNKNVITIDSAGVAYRFDLYSAPRAERFMAILVSTCETLNPR